MTTIQIANAPCSWGVLEFDLEGESQGYAQVLDEMAQSGYKGLEFGDWGFLPTEPDVLQQELQSRDLTMLGAFVPVAFANSDTIQQGINDALKIAKLLVAVNPSPYIVLADDNGSIEARTKKAGRIQAQDGLSDEQWPVFAKNVEQVARAIVDETGVKSVFHHHCAGYVETPSEVERLLELIDPDLIGLCFDTGHFQYGGGNAADYLKSLWDRIWHVHFKDCQPDVAQQACTNEWDYFESVKNGVFCELGQGAVDFPSIVKELHARNYDGWIVVEQDVLPGMGTPLDSATRNRNYIKSLGL